MTATVGENLERHGVEMVHGDARLGPDRSVIVRDPEGRERTLRARVVLLATGSRPYHPPDIPFEDPDVHDSETILSIERLPERILVVGGGPGRLRVRLDLLGARRRGHPRRPWDNACCRSSIVSCRRPWRRT